jgi:hypothetical protein
MMLRYLLSLLPFLLATVTLPGQAAATAEESITAEEFLEHASYLASDEMRGRMTGSEEIRRAGEYIAAHMKACGLRPAGAQRSWFMPFNARVGRTCRNVCGLLPGTSLKREVLVIGAHYDHVGIGAVGSRSGQRGEIHNGADDNASGTAALMELMEAFAGDRPRRSILFIAFSGDELGLLGSTAWCKKPTLPLGSVVAMLNLDMMGRSRDGYLFVGGVHTGQGLREVVTRANTGLGFELELHGGGRGPSDFQPFYQRQIPVLFFFTGEHDQYHTPQDDVELLDGPAGARVTRLAYRVARQLAEGKRRKWLRDDRSAMPQNSPRGQNQAWLLLGMLLGKPTGQEPGLPVKKLKRKAVAAAKGIREGDRILEIDGRPARSVAGINRHLSSLALRSKVRVRYQRGKRRGVTRLPLTLDD